MPTLHIAILAVIQGITEFLPISSSGHLVLVPVVLDVPDQGLIMDVAVHVGTLGAVVLYLWREIWTMLLGLARAVRGRRDPGSRLAGQVVLATIPVIAAGYALNHYYPNGLRGLEVLGWATLGFGVLLLIADRIGMTLRRIEHLGYGDVLIIGLAQALALIPGTSRSGITMTAGRLLGMERTDAARFSLLLSIPAVAGAGALKGYELWQTGNEAVTSDIILAAFLAFVTALIAITLMIAWLRRATFAPFAVYRVGLGAAILALFYGWI